MISMGDKIGIAIVALFVILLFVFWEDVKSFSGIKTEGEKDRKENTEKKKSKKDNEDKGVNTVSKVFIQQKWELPSALKEVSGITYIDDQRFACVQDEKGTIFIFNRKSNQIEREIPFAGSGDYEGITLKDNMAYVVRADGMLYEVSISSEKSFVKEYRTPLTAEHNIEGLCYDKNSDRLLLAIKDDEPGKPGYKGVYGFDLSKKFFIKEPAYKIDLQHEVISTSQNKSMMPSAIAVHPLTKEIYVTDGPQARLLVMDSSGNIKKLWQLGKDFSQPEGITFSPGGEMFISNEGTKLPGNILKVELQ